MFGLNVQIECWDRVSELDVEIECSNWMLRSNVRTDYLDWIVRLNICKPSRISAKTKKFNAYSSLKRHVYVTDISVTGFSKFDRHGCLTVTGFTNKRPIKYECSSLTERPVSAAPSTFLWVHLLIACSFPQRRVAASQTPSLAPRAAVWEFPPKREKKYCGVPGVITTIATMTWIHCKFLGVLVYLKKERDSVGDWYCLCPCKQSGETIKYQWNYS